MLEGQQTEHHKVVTFKIFPETVQRYDITIAQYKSLREILPVFLNI